MVILLRELPRAGWGLTAAVGASTLLRAVGRVLFSVASGVAVAAVPAAVGEGFDSAAGRRLALGAAGAGLLFALTQAAEPVEGLLISRIANRLRRRTQRRALAATLGPRTVAHLETPELLDKVAAATLLSPAGPGAAVRALLNLLHSRAMALASLAVLARFRWWLAAALLVTQWALGRRWAAIYGRLVAFRVLHLPGLRRAVYLRELAMEPGAAKETRAFGLAAWVVERFRGAWLGAMADIWAGRRGNFARVAGAAAPVIAAHAATALLLGRATIEGDIGLAACVTYAQSALFSLGLCFSGGDLALSEGAGVLTATAELERATGHDPRLVLPGTRPADRLPEKEVRFEGVSFSYPGQDRPVLDGLDLHIPAGRSLAVVGDNGAGKTTLVKLLTRLYDPSQGRVTADGTDLRELDPASWQARTAAVFQDFVRYPLTAADNVALGRPADRESLERAARRAGVLEVVESLPRGWETVLSREFEGGVDLSGGEWQRIALARALFAAEATGGGVLVLDEPTAHLDARAEAAFFDAFFEVTSGCTSVVISHRFSTVRCAERIVVLEGGKVAEAGTHPELLAAGGRYARMFSLQASRFQAAQA